MITAFPDLNNWVDRMDLRQFNTKVYYDNSITEVLLDRQKELDFCSRLISHMWLNSAMDVEMRDIIAYSMVVLDAVKEKLNWKKAAEDFHVKEMVEKYMNGGDAE